MPSAVFPCQLGQRYSQAHHQKLTDATLRYSVSRSQPNTFTKLGAVWTCRVLRDGRRHIAEFYLARDFFGYEAADKHALSAETIFNSEILVIKCNVLTALAEHDKDIAHHLSGPCHTVNKDVYRTYCRLSLGNG